MAFLKQASLTIENPEVQYDSWVGYNPRIKTASKKLVEYKKIIADFNPNDYLLTHCTIVASVNVENGPKEVHFASEKTKKEFDKLVGRKDYYITPDTSKYVNSNGDAWARDLLLASYKSFIGAENYVEHVQDPSLSKGKILDAAIRTVDDGKSLFVDILVATNKKYDDLVNKIKTGKLKTLSMGSVVAFTICSECGRVAADETELCPHIKFLKRNHFISPDDGKKRVIAELCGSFLYPDSNKFIEGSWVENPAFKGAVMRNELTISNLDQDIFQDDNNAVLDIKSNELKHTANKVILAFNLVDKIKLMFNDKKSFTEEILPEESAPDKIPADIPDDLSKDPDTEEPIKEDPKEELPTTEEPPAEENNLEDIPSDLKQMGEPPVDNTLDNKFIEEEAKEPYDTVKKDVKDTLKEDIKKELLQEFGVKEKKEEPSRLDNVDLNDTLVHSSKLSKILPRLKKAKIIIKNQGWNKLASEGFSKSEILKIAYLSNRYSINKEVFAAIDTINIKDFLTYRRIFKAIEQKIGREISVGEKIEIKKLFKDLC